MNENAVESTTRISLFDLIACISETLDLVSPVIANHHAQVAYIAHALATELRLSTEARQTLFIAAALHDIGSFSIKERINILNFETNNPHTHARIGYGMLREFDPFQQAAEIVRHHHVHIDSDLTKDFPGETIHPLAYLLHLADRIAVLVRPSKPILGQAAKIVDRIEKQRGKMFVPEQVDAFRALAKRDYFWFDVVSHSPSNILRRRTRLPILELDQNGLSRLANLFRRIIDFRSRFTATHSSGVAHVAAALGKLCGMGDQDCQRLQIAGYLHDLGKVGIPSEILEKPGKLDENEYSVMRAHVYYTYRILENLGDLETIRLWGALHQEYLDGQGYPFGLTANELSQGSRIVGVADVFTALMEDRPYRKGMTQAESLIILENMATANKLDAAIIALMKTNFDAMNQVRANAQQAATHEYDTFFATLS